MSPRLRHFFPPLRLGLRHGVINIPDLLDRQILAPICIEQISEQVGKSHAIRSRVMNIDLDKTPLVRLAHQSHPDRELSLKVKRGQEAESAFCRIGSALFSEWQLELAHHQNPLIQSIRSGLEKCPQRALRRQYTTECRPEAVAIQAAHVGHCEGQVVRNVPLIHLLDEVELPLLG